MNPMKTREEEFAEFAAGAVKVASKPQPFFAKRIKSVKCLNPREKISYHYERIHEMTFEDGTVFVRGEDHWRRPGVQMKKGNWVLLLKPHFTEMYLTPDEFAAGYDMV
jgi:hypothetical protein